MNAILALGLLSLALSLLLTPLCRDLALRFNLVDVPDGKRKGHRKPIPRIGGVAIVLAYAGSLAFMLGVSPLSATISIQHKGLLWNLLPAVAIIFSIGLIDDLITLRPWQKLSGQMVGAVVAVHAGARITLLDHQPHSAWLTIPLSILWLLVCTNAFNLIDGLDGLASGVGLFATITTLLAAILQGNWGLAMATVPLAGCLLGFLRYNFNPASVFLGDCGSLSIGFLLGCFGVIWSQKSATFLGMLAPLMALALPLFDVALSIGRRFLRNRPIFEADAGHIHHRLLGHGFHPRTVAIILYATCGVAAFLSLLQSSFGHHVGGVSVILFCVLALVGINKLGYLEFKAAKQVLSWNILALVRHEVYLAHLREALLKVDTRADFWLKVRDACRDMNFTSVRLMLDNRIYEEYFDLRPESGCQTSMRFNAESSIVLWQTNHHATTGMVTSLFRVLQDCLDNKIFLEPVRPPDKEISIHATV